MNKRAQSTGFSCIYGLVSLFGLGVLYIVFNQVFIAHLVPTVKGMVNATYPIALDAATQAQINGNIDKYMDFFNILPFILFFVVVIYMFVAAIRKEQESQFV